MTLTGLACHCAEPSVSVHDHVIIMVMWSSCLSICIQKRERGRSSSTTKELPASLIRFIFSGCRSARRVLTTMEACNPVSLTHSIPACLPTARPPSRLLTRDSTEHAAFLPAAALETGVVVYDSERPVCRDRERERERGQIEGCT